MKLDLAVLSVVGVERVVCPLSSIVLNILLQHRVPVNQKPAESSKYCQILFHQQ